MEGRCGVIGYEEKELMAALFDNAADQLGRSMAAVEQVARRDADTLHAESDNLDAVLIDGAKVLKALRAVSRRYVR